ncbi:MAG: penicillin-binding protein 2 [Ignavibacteria bacterium]|nr:penicillin-binding protein 2 [Ignavibacteria bacterium]
MRAATTDKEFGSSKRQRIFQYVILAVAAVFILRLGWMQIIQGGAYRLKAEAQAIKQVKVEPFRGMMFDRNGRAIVQNAPGFSITITPYEFTDSAAKLLSALLDVPDSLIWDEVHRAAVFNRFNPSKISYGRDIDYAVLSFIEERRDELPGVDIIIDSKRLYAFDGNASHLLGYTREVSEWHLKNLGDSYDPGDITGQTGLEKAYEQSIRGQKGFQFIAVNNKGRRVAKFNDGKSDIEAKEGNDLYLGLDTDLQELAEKLIAPHNGGVVALDPSNGEILCYVSSPDYDLRQFSGRTSRKYLNTIDKDAKKPLFNRVSMPQYSPGSTWKPLMALAALQEGIITPTSKLYCAGGYQYGNRFARCHGGVHGSIDLNTALTVSCNAFFYQLGVKLGMDRIHYYGNAFGFGRKTNADITEESKGVMPDSAYLNRQWGKGNWTDYVVMNWAIGQGELAVTPLQMLSYIATIANEGTWNQPHAVRAMYDKTLNKMLTFSYAKNEIPIDKEHFRTVKQMLRSVVSSGTGRGIDIPGLDVAGKTGTAQALPGQKDQSWFVCFAPLNNPKIALVVTAEGGGFGATTALPIARKLLEQYLLNKWPEEIGRDSTWIQQGGVVSDSTSSNPQVPKLNGPFAPELKPKSVKRYQPSVVSASLK